MLLTNPLSAYCLQLLSLASVCTYPQIKENETFTNHILLFQFKKYICILFLKVLVMTQIQFSVASVIFVLGKATI